MLACEPKFKQFEFAAHVACITYNDLCKSDCLTKLTIASYIE